MNVSCEICGTPKSLDRHHVIPKGMGGSRSSAVHDANNLMTLCRTCHANLHEGRWRLDRYTGGIRVYDDRTGKQIMRRLSAADGAQDASFQVLNLSSAAFDNLIQHLPHLTDEELVEAFHYAKSFGKKAWLIQAAILYEAQQRSVYGEHTLEAIARRFEIGQRQAQKYALVWSLFFASHPEEESVNIDAIMLDEASWYIVAATEAHDPEKWLTYAQDRKAEDPRYNVAEFRRDIQVANKAQAYFEALSRRGIIPPWASKLRCPWVRPYCTNPGVPTSLDACHQCIPGATHAVSSPLRGANHQTMEETQ